MTLHVTEPIPLQFDFNVVIANLSKVERNEGLKLLEQLQENIVTSLQILKGYETEYAEIPLGGKTVFEQQKLLYQALLEWLDNFHGQYIES